MTDDLLIEEIYAGATEGRGWTALLNQLGERLNAAAIGLSFETRVGGKPVGVGQVWTGLDRHFERRYVDHYWRTDPFRDFGRGLPQGTTVHSGMFGARYESTEFYVDLCRPFGLSHLAASVVSNSESSMVAIGAMRALGDPEFGEGECALLQRVGPHLRRALDVANRLAAPSALTPTIFDRLAVAAVLLDAAGRVLLINRRGLEVLQREEAVLVHHDRLTFASPKALAWFQRAITDATGATPRTGSAFRLHRPSGRLPLLVRITPVRSGACFDSRAAALLVIEDSAAAPPRAKRFLVETLGLSEREAEVACLVGNGLSPKEVASHLSTAWNTVRFQLRSVYEKTGTRGQVELARLVASLDVPWE